MGNVVVWKPAENQSLAAYHTMRLFEAAGLPPGVINVVYGDGAKVAETCLRHRDLAGVHFTGSTKVFQSIWRTVGENIASYKSYPRLVGETGGKDFVFAHPSAEVEALAVALVRGAYEFQGQKCSAASRAYIPRSIWPQVRDLCAAHIEKITMGDVTDFRNFMGAVINERAWTRLSGWHERLKADSGVKIIADNGWSRDKGWFCGPTLAEVDGPRASPPRRGALRPRARRARLRRRQAERRRRGARPRRPHEPVRPHGRGVRARSRGGRARPSRVSVRRRATCTSTTSRPAPSSASSRSAAVAPPARTTRRAARTTCFAGPRPRVVKETFVPPLAVGYPFMGAE